NASRKWHSSARKHSSPSQSRASRLPSRMRNTAPIRKPLGSIARRTPPLRPLSASIQPCLARAPTTFTTWLCGSLNCPDISEAVTKRSCSARAKYISTRKPISENRVKRIVIAPYDAYDTFHIHLYRQPKAPAFDLDQTRWFTLAGY